MALGSLANGVCYENVAAATDAYFSGLPPVSAYDPVALILTTTDFHSVLGVWFQRQITVDALGVQLINFDVPAVLPAFPLCVAPSEYFNDGVIIGGAIVAVMFIGWAFVAMVKAL